MDPFDDFAESSHLHVTSDYHWAYRHKRLLNAGLVILAICVFTRFVSSRTGRSSVRQDGIKTPPPVPYWFPLFGHVFSMGWNSQKFLSNQVLKYEEGIFTLNIFGTRLHYLYGPDLSTALVNTHLDNADFQSVQQTAAVNIFDLPKRELGTFNAMYTEYVSFYHRHLMGEPGLAKMIDNTLQSTKLTVKDLVTGSESEVDQLPWERVSRVSNTVDKQGEKVVEADLFPLILDFAGYIVTKAIAGSNLLENSPSFLSNLWTLNTGFVLLGLGLPRWFPIPSLTKAHIARRNIMHSLDALETALDKEANHENPGPTWSDVDDVSDILKARQELYRKKDVSIHARSSLDLSLIWAANANSNPLIFWMLLHIYSDPSLLVHIRQEIAPFVHLIEPEQQFGIPEPPRFEELDVEGLCTKGPLLRSIYYECIRLRSYQQSPKVAKQDFVLKGKGEGAEAYLIRKGDWCFAAHGLHQKDPRFFGEPEQFKADRFVKVDEKGQATVSIDSMKPFGGGSSICKGRTFAVKKVIFVVAAIVAMWDMEPAGGGTWRMPEERISVAVSGVKDNTRVWIKRRNLKKSTDGSS